MQRIIKRISSRVVFCVQHLKRKVRVTQTHNQNIDGVVLNPRRVHLPLPEPISTAISFQVACLFDRFLYSGSFISYKKGLSLTNSINFSVSHMVAMLLFTSPEKKSERGRRAFLLTAAVELSCVARCFQKSHVGQRALNSYRGTRDRSLFPSEGYLCYDE